MRLTILVICVGLVSCSFPENCGKPAISPDVPDVNINYNGRIIHGTEVDHNTVLLKTIKIHEGSI